MDHSPPGSSVHGISQARIMEWMPFPPSGYFLNPGIESVSLASPALAGRFFTTATLGKPFWSVQSSPVAQVYPTFCDPMDCSTAGLPVHHQLLEFTQTHVHWVDDAIQPLHPLLSPSLPAWFLSKTGLRRMWEELHYHSVWPLALAASDTPTTIHIRAK